MDYFLRISVELVVISEETLGLSFDGSSLVITLMTQVTQYLSSFTIRVDYG